MERMREGVNLDGEHTNELADAWKNGLNESLQFIHKENCMEGFACHQQNSKRKSYSFWCVECLYKEDVCVHL